MVVDLTPGRAGSRVQPLVSLSHNRVLFLASGDGRGEGLWVSDGTARGTVRLRDSIGSTEIVSTGDFAFFTGLAAGAPYPTGGNAIFRTDGTPAGTVEVTRVPPGRGGLWAKSLATWGSYLIFNNSSSNGNGVWRSDGTAAGTVQLIPEAERAATTSSHSYTPYRRALYFATPGGLWRSDGTPAGTRIVRRMAGIAWGMAVGGDGMLYFFAPRDGTSGGAPALWRSDGTRDGTRPLPDLGTGADAAVRLTSAGDFLYFRTSAALSNGATRQRLWRTDGTPRGTVLLESDTSELIYAPAEPFAGRSPIFGSREGVKVTDGTAAGTAPLGSSTSNPAPIAAHEIVRLKGALLVMGRSDGSRYLWRVDPPGTVAGVVFNDADGDGRIDAGENRLAGFRVFVDANRNGRYDRDEVWSRTNARGEYQLLGVEAGTHAVGVTPVEGWVATPRPFKSVSVRPGESTRVHFGQKRIG